MTATQANHHRLHHRHRRHHHHRHLRRRHHRFHRLRRHHHRLHRRYFHHRCRFPDRCHVHHHLRYHPSVRVLAHHRAEEQVIPWVAAAEYPIQAVAPGCSAEAAAEQAGNTDGIPSTVERDRMAAAVESARQTETEAGVFRS